MTEAGPSSPSRTYSSLSAATTTSNPTSLSRHTQIRFPVDESRSSLADDSRDANFIGLGPPPIVRRSTVAQAKNSLTSDRRGDDVRRRVRSADTVALGGHPFLADHGRLSSKHSRRIHSRKSPRRDVANVFSDGPSELSLSSAFSDEYDLSREDPRIIEDVQRAIRLKTRREARLKAARMSSIQGDTQLRSDRSTFPAHSSPVRSHLQMAPSLAHVEDVSNDTEVDFSPSIGTMPLHPVPSSSNGGATLDWTGSTSEDEKAEKRWPLHLPKRKHKDRSSLPSSRNVVEKQDTIYADKLARIRSSVQGHTLRKAEITSDQLQRRYHMLLSHQPSINLLQVAHWYKEQEPVVKASLDKAEPLTWLKHLENHGHRSARSPWLISALTVEEFAKTHSSHPTMATIPEDAIPDSSPNTRLYPETISPSSGSLSWNTSPQFLEPSLTRRRSYDAQVSFEPHLESGKESVGEESRPSSEGFAKYWRHSLPVGTESAPSSIYSGILNRDAGSSSKSGHHHHHHHLRNLARRLRRRAYDSEDGLSSSRNSLSEHERSFSEDGIVKTPGKKARSQPASMRAKSPETNTDDDRVVSEPELRRRQSSENILTATAESFKQDGGGAGDGTPRPDMSVGPTGAPPIPPLRRPVPRRRHRTSLPSRRVPSPPESLQPDVDEEEERAEYERKLQILDDTTAQNHRIRNLLQQVGASIRDYDGVQSSITDALGISYPKIPADVLEAFSHDPSAVTSTTRYTSGWRAVEDIHERVCRQRETLGAFAMTMLSQPEDANTSPQNVFHDPIASLKESLMDLERHQQRIATQADNVAETLARVKEVHRTVKKDYNDTLAHTSLIYPELSQIVALEESYRNHYQQFWDLGLDALTLLLDTVTPFWRNYGKVIGEDIQDFLIIPWYRNEFTGEAKRYPVTQFPRRSLRHWLGLSCLSLLSLCTTVLQLRAAVELTLNWDLPWITHTGLWWIVFPIYSISLLIQWCAVLVELCIVFAQLGVGVWWLGWAVNILT